MQSIQDSHDYRLSQLEETEIIRGGVNLTELETKKSTNEIISTFSRIGSEGLWKLKTTKFAYEIRHELFPPNKEQPSSVTVDNEMSGLRYAGGLI